MKIQKIDSLISRIDGDFDISKLSIITADELEHSHHPPFAAEMPILVLAVQSLPQLHLLGDLLARIYEPGQETIFLDESSKKPLRSTLGNLTALKIDKYPVSLFIPENKPGYAYESFEEIVAHLRAQDGCPWDKEQTHASLRPHLLEETYEVLDAMDRNDPDSLKEELGDLLLQIVLNAQIATEDKEFRMADVLNGIYSKIIRRHPHVFGDANIGEVDNVLRNWERLKETERKDNGTSDTKGILDGVPLSLPALLQAEGYQERAARVGFDWKTIEPVIAKMYEEFEETKQAKNEVDRAKELGDLLFAAVNVIRWYNVDAESALRGANQRFVARFKYIEQVARKKKKNLSELSFEEMDELWNEAKKKKIGS